jgi:hypothetical protein
VFSSLATNRNSQYVLPLYSKFPEILHFCNTLVGRTPFALKTWGAGSPIYSSMRRCPV